MHFVGYLNIMDWRVNIYCVEVGDCKSPCYECLAAMCVGKCNPQLAVLCKLITAVLMIRDSWSLKVTMCQPYVRRWNVDFKIIVRCV